MIKIYTNNYKVHSFLALLIGFLIFISTNIQAQTYFWEGNTSTDWNTAANWNPVAVPGINDFVQINSGYTNVPTLTSDVTISGLRISNIINGNINNAVGTSIINVNNFKLTVGYIKSPTSATGVFFLENSDVFGGPGQVSFIVSCTGACTNGAFIVNGSIITSINFI